MGYVALTTRIWGLFVIQWLTLDMASSSSSSFGQGSSLLWTHMLRPL